MGAKVMKPPCVIDKKITAAGALGQPLQPDYRHVSESLIRYENVHQKILFILVKIIGVRSFPHLLCLAQYWKIKLM
jgi:hypothetical protein